MRPIKKKGSKVKAKPLPLEVTKEELDKFTISGKDGGNE